MIEGSARGHTLDTRGTSQLHTRWQKTDCTWSHAHGRRKLTVVEANGTTTCVFVGGVTQLDSPSWRGPPYQPFAIEQTVPTRRFAELRTCSKGSAGGVHKKGWVHTCLDVWIVSPSAQQSPQRGAIPDADPLPIGL